MLPLACAALAACSPASPAARPTFDAAFWGQWGDGRAELSAYDLVHPRYGAERRGVAVAIWVTETLDLDQYVKAEVAQCCAAHELPVMKLNLIEDFPTGIYDYNLMTSSWVALGAARGLAPGDPVKVTFSAQEWCGQVYQQLRFFGREVESTSHSYFQGEADQTERRAWPTGALAEDTLWSWARGFAGPLLAPGERREVPLLSGLADSRLRHVPLRTVPATLTRQRARETVELSAGRFEVERYEATFGAETLTFWVEVAPPRRVVRFAGRGKRLDLLGSARLKYWELNGPGGERFLEGLGLRPRPLRTP